MAIDIFKLIRTKPVSDLNDPETANLHREIINKNTFLKKVYLDFYKEFYDASLNLPKGQLVEIGSGAGFLKEIMPNVITSDVFHSKGIDMVFSATDLPFDSNSVSAFFLNNVLHHINAPRTFFSEVRRCLVPGGKIIMIEPYSSLMGRFLYKNFHHEPFDMKADWEIKDSGRLTAANLALAWIIFFRDREKFEKEFPNLRIKRLIPHTPFRYQVSGGLSVKQLLPAFMHDIVKGFEAVLLPLNKYIGMFITIELEKNNQ
ncbi:MAG: hypothetical protein A3B68_04370 [Candidatus Melainabacteria bacterium RIFCSPHIGHO2_02_FULL_34_12]|nr:MAG: hypothetical protein A3B68_04370 [Candidatus Melainabacteria bacterium RIFCSPHIGHO2_02_FULL_34_12]